MADDSKVSKNKNRMIEEAKKAGKAAIDVITYPSRVGMGAGIAAGAAVDQFAVNNSKKYRDSGLAGRSSMKGTGYRDAKAVLKTAVGMDTADEELAEAREKSTPQAGYKKGGKVAAPKGWGKARYKK